MKKRRRRTPKVYLLHFHLPLLDSKGKPKAQHYLGMSRNMDKRVALHRAGQSNSRIMLALHAKGIGFDVVATWDGDEHLERSIKRKKRVSMLCPMCHAAYLKKERERRERRRAASAPAAVAVE